MSRNISKYDRLRALVRNPIYLKDLKTIKSRFNFEEQQSFLEKYKLSIPVTPDLVNKYSPEVWENTAVFTDDEAVRIILKKKPKMIEVEPDLFKYDYAECFKESKTLGFEIDLTMNKAEILDKISSHISFFKNYISPPKRRKKPDQKIDRFEVWDEYKKCHDFSKIARKGKVDRTTIRKAYLRAFQDIMGEKYDPKKHNRRHVEKAELAVTCDVCTKRATCDTPCAEILEYLKQDEMKLRERRTSDILPDYLS